MSNLEAKKPLAAERKTSMPTTNNSSDYKNQNEISPVSKLAQLERDQKLRQMEQSNSLSCDATGEDNEEKLIRDDANNKSKDRVRFP